MYYWRGNGKAKREWAAHWHGLATVIGLQHESLSLAHRTTTVKCSKGHVRHAMASDQLPLGPMHDALRAPLVPPGHDVQASEDLFMDLDEPPSKRSRDTPSSAQQSDFANPNEFVLRARNVSVPLPRTPEQHVPALETPFQAVPHGNVAPVTPRLFRSDEAMPSTPPFHCFLGGEIAPVSPCHHSQFPCRIRCPAHLKFHPRCPRILLLHTPTSQRKLTKVTRNQQVTF